MLSLGLDVLTGWMEVDAFVLACFFGVNRKVLMTTYEWDGMVLQLPVTVGCYIQHAKNLRMIHASPMTMRWSIKTTYGETLGTLLLLRGVWYFTVFTCSCWTDICSTVICWIFTFVQAILLVSHLWHLFSNNGHSLNIRKLGKFGCLNRRKREIVWEILIRPIYVIM